MREYELVLITKADIPENDFLNIKNKIESIIKKYSGSLIKVENFGKKKLAYPIKKDTKGNFYNFVYSAKGATLNELQENLNIEENVIRYQCNVLPKKPDIFKSKKK